MALLYSLLTSLFLPYKIRSEEFHYMKNNTNKLRFWILVWGLGIIGQLCWNIENQWFNTFVYAKIAKDPTIISWMVAISAIATTISTFLFGTLSDRSGKRKPFLAYGYIIWGIFTILFGTTEFITKGQPSASASVILVAGTAVVLADALMSFFGSMGNDASFNAWLNDMMTEENRGSIGAALATQPIIGTIIGTILGGLLIGANDNYMRLFIAFGGLAILFGFLSLVLVKDSEDLKPNKEGSFFSQLMSAFNYKELLKHKELLWVFLTLTVYFIAFNVYYPHVGNYMIYYLGFGADDIGIIQGVALILGMLSVIPATKLLNKDKFVLAASISVVLTMIGLLILGLFGRPQYIDPSTIFNWPMLIGLFFFGCGYIMFMQVTSVWMKQLFPEDSKGQFEGFRIIFFVLIPWIVSPFIANPIIKNNGEILDSNGLTAYLPTHVLFLVSTLLILATFVPLLLAAKQRKKG
ncbi:MAG: MFS transporter [Erysipelotrichaceae bacterium]|nr:MFS transporter [Erysipelotrichaceae bacterium]